MVLLTVHSAVDLGGWQHIVCVLVITLYERFEYFLKKNYATCLLNCKKLSEFNCVIFISNFFVLFEWIFLHCVYHFSFSIEFLCVLRKSVEKSHS